MQSNLFVTNLWKGFQKRIAQTLNQSDLKAGLSWWKIKYLKHAPAGTIKTFRYNESDIFYRHPIELLHTLREIFVAEIYATHLPENSYIIDCGANIGLGVIYFKEKNPSAEILAFEPDENNFQLLQRNIDTRNWQNVVLRKEAVWNNDTTLHFSNDGSMGSKINATANAGIKVNATRLKTLLIRKVDFLKIDIEGAEYEVIKDIAENLFQVQNMFLEYHGDFSQNKELTEIINIITHAGFHYYIKEAANVYARPFFAMSSAKQTDFDVQLNIFCFRK